MTGKLLIQQHGDITFYVSSIATNNNNSTSGDKLYTSTLAFEAPPATCSITNLSATAQSCQADGNFDVVIDFDVSDAGTNNTFAIEGNGNNYGTFNYNDLPITIADLAGDNTTSYEFTVTDTNEVNCSSNTTLGILNCPVCSISNLSTTAQACQADGNFDVLINFTVTNPGTNNTFTLTGNGNNYGTFNYNALPLTLQDLAGDNTTNYEFVVTDSNDSNCTANTTLGLVDCPVCTISNLVATPQSCETDGTFDVSIDFDVANAGGMFFSVSGNGNTYGVFNYNSLPITLNSLTGDNVTDYEFVVTDNTVAACTASTNVGVIDCPVCSISNLSVNPTMCEMDGTFDVTIDFDVVNAGNTFFSITGNGNSYGAFNYNALPITLTDLMGDNTTDYEFVVTDNTINTCTASSNLGVVDCPVCSISNLSATQGFCDLDGTFDVTIDFDVVNSGSSGFTIGGNGTDYGTFQYADLPVTLANLVGDNSTAYEFVVTDVDLSDCTANTTLGVVDCPVCSINDLSVTQSSDCQEDGTFSVTIDFNVVNSISAFFNIGGNGTNYGDFEYSDLPITIGGLIGDNTTAYEFVVTDTELASCSAATGLGVVNCPVCGINDLSVTQGDCQADGTFSVMIDFNVVNPSSASFTVGGNGTDYGTFQYADLPITIGGLVGDNTTAYEFVVTDAELGSCSAAMDLGVMNCPVCNISDLTVDLSDCNDNGTYSLTINFNHANTLNVGFDVFSEGTSIGFFSYNDLPVTIESFQNGEGAMQSITVSDNDNATCSATVEFEGLDCPVVACAISNVIAEAHECDEDGNFLVDIDFDVVDGGSGFTIVGNGSSYGTFEYGQEFYTIGPLEGDGMTEYEFIVTDLDDENCSAFTGLDAIDCFVPACSITDLSVMILDCDSDGNFSVEIDFNFADVGDDGFRIAGNGNNYGSFNYGDLPIVIGGLAGDGMTEYEFVVVDIQNEDCSAVTGIGEVTCEGTPCGFDEVSVQVGECNEDGTYPVVLNFVPVTPTNTSFDLFTGETFLGFFAYADLPITIESFPTDGGEFDSITISDNDNAECSVTYDFEAQNCEVLECAIGELGVESLGCDEEGNFSVSIGFNFENVGNDGFKVRGNGNDYGDFSYDDLPITIGGLAGDGVTPYEFVVIDNAMDGCSSVVEFGTLACDVANCMITNVIAEAHPCNQDGQFFVDIAFDVESPDSQSFTIRENGTEYGTFAYGAPFYTVGPIDGDGTTIYEFIVTDAENADCSDFTGLDPIDCTSEPCSISNITTEIGECSDEGTFDLTVDFDHENEESPIFILSLNGVPIGEFAYEDLPVTVEEVDANVVEIYDIDVMDPASEDCGTNVQINSPDCPVLTCTADAGEMPSETVLVCHDDTAPIAAEGTVLENDDVLVYILHTSPNETLGDIIEIFFSPQVNNTNLSGNTNTEYYFSAVAGPEGDTDDNFPDLNSECTKIAAGTPVVFLQPIEISTTEDCDPETEITTVTIAINGGLPAYFHSAIYEINGSFVGEVAYNETFSLGGVQIDDVYTIIATDSNDCTASLTSEPVDCVIDNIANQTPISFSLEELSPNPVSDWLHLEIEAATPHDLTMRIYDTAGRVLLEGMESLKVGGNDFDWNVSAYPTGIYLLYLQNSEGVVVERFSLR